jgi:hypothetical protein
MAIGWIGDTLMVLAARDIAHAELTSKLNEENPRLLTAQQTARSKTVLHKYCTRRDHQR